MGIFRLYMTGEREPVGVVVAKSKTVANAFAQGKYGAASYAQRVDYKSALEVCSVCEVLSTMVERITLDKTLRVVA